MKVTREGSAPVVLLNTTLAGNPIPGAPPVDPGDVPDPIDLAADAVATVPLPVAGSVSVVQTKYNDAFAGSVVVTLDDDPTEGNVLVAFQVARSSTTPLGPSGWTAHPRGIDHEQGTVDGKIGMFWTVVTAGMSPVITGDYDTGNYVAMTVVELAGVTRITDDDGISTQSDNHPILTLTPEAFSSIIIMGAGMLINDGETATFTPDSGSTEVTDSATGGSRWPRMWLGYRLVPSPSGSYSVGATYPYTQSWAAQALVFDDGGGGDIWVEAPEVVDTDDATYRSSDVAEGLRIDLGAPTRLTSVRVLIGSNSSGSKTYELWGANEDDFSDAVEVASQTFTATGSFTPDEVLYTVTDLTAYRYWSFHGPASARRWFTVEMFGVTGFSLALDDLSDVDTTGKDDADVLTWDETTGLWIAAAPSGGMTNPMTTAGDIIVGGSSGTPGRLAKGSDGDVLTIDASTHLPVWDAAGGVTEITDLPTSETDTDLVLHPDGAGGVEWGADATGGGGGGDLTKLAETILGSDAANITITGISGAYKDLIVVWEAREDAAVDIDFLYMRLGNGSIDTGSNYTYVREYNGSAGGTNTNTGDTKGDVGTVTGNSSPAGAFASGRLEILDYASTTKRRNWMGQSYQSGTGVYTGTVFGAWTNASAAIDQVRIYSPSGNLKAGSRLALYGRT